MKQIRSFLVGKYPLWILLAIPGILVIINYLKGKLNYEMMMHISGEFAGRMLIISLIATPLKMLFPKGKVSKWLVRNRRFFGVSAFAYTLLHTIFYVLEYSISQLTNEFLNLSILTGWITFFIFIPLAITSTNTAIKKMGSSWKKLQRWVYVAAILTFTHWIFIGLQSNNASTFGAIFHFIPVMVLQVYRVWKQTNDKKY
ncbi:MAG: sulfite oxidase heme-binding subunit YedZ [Polaribacter sp.]